ncbi:hypothetical protein F2Q69_00010062 [Brassica cretica]|uniref:Metallo-beta-lactamase domain-containing protein n=1 Tax=Brassica cretica TaxID=69181 RepID=A0A8S9NVF0_BRACR|nr:hypothetical protein F2Q69_00010062 [Brassica cretica]
MVVTRFSRLQHLLLLQPRFQQSRVLRRPLTRTPTLIRSVMGSSSSSSSKLLFRQLFEKESSTYTYLLADISHPDKPALLIDPVDKTVDRDLKLINELGLKLVYAMNTHVHADHVTGTGLLKTKVPGVKSVISKASGSKADKFVEHGEKVSIGDIHLEVRATPGHTAGCVTYVTGEGADRPQPRMAFTGDAVLIRGCGRTDFQGGCADQLYESVHSQASFFTLSCHFTGRLIIDLVIITVVFLCPIIDLNLAYPKLIDVALPANMVCGLQDLLPSEAN